MAAAPNPRRRLPCLVPRRLTFAAMTLLGSVAIASAQTALDAAHHPGSPASAAAPGGMPMMDMSKMMQMMRGMTMSGRGGMSMMPFEHIEGRIAFLKAELAITDTAAAMERVCRRAARRRERH